MTSVRSQIIDNTFFGMGGFIDKAILPYVSGCSHRVYSCFRLGKYLNCADNNNDPWTNGCDNFPFKPILKLCNDDAAMVDALTVTQVRSPEILVLLTFRFLQTTISQKLRLMVWHWLQFVVTTSDGVRELVTYCWYRQMLHITWLVMVSLEVFTIQIMYVNYLIQFYYQMDCNVARRPIVTGANFPSGAGTGEDYVSVGQLKEVLIRNNIVPIFAVLNDRPSMYRMNMLSSSSNRRTTCLHESAKPLPILCRST